MLPLLKPGTRVIWTASGTHNPADVPYLPPALEAASLAELLHPGEATSRGDGLQRYATS